MLMGNLSVWECSPAACAADVSTPTAKSNDKSIRFTGHFVTQVRASEGRQIE